MSNVNEYCKRLEELLKELKDYKALSKRLTDEMNADPDNKTAKEQQIDQLNLYILQLLEAMDSTSTDLIGELDLTGDAKPAKIEIPEEVTIEPIALVEEKKIEVETPVPSKKFMKLDKKTEKLYLAELNLDKKYFEKIRKKDAPEKELARFSVYKPSGYGRLANRFFDRFLGKLKTNNPKMFDNMYKNLRSSDIKILSRTYLNMVFLTTFLAFIIGWVGSVVAFKLVGRPIVFGVVIGVFTAFLIGVLTFVLMYAYPGIAMSSRRKMIRNDLPFMIIHMAAVAGSGAHPISVFNLILRSGEYKGLEEEIRRIVNYTNLFGYDLNTALKTVARTTPSLDFKELLNGISTTIESGGDMTVYLKAKAQDSMTKYKLARQKYVETLAAYSDIYTGVLIAAPLLFLVTLAIINILGGNIGGFSAKAIASFGTFIAIPLLNIGFIIFLSVTQPEI